MGLSGLVGGGGWVALVDGVAFVGGVALWGGVGLVGGFGPQPPEFGRSAENIQNFVRLFVAKAKIQVPRAEPKLNLQLHDCLLASVLNNLSLQQNYSTTTFCMNICAWGLDKVSKV